MNTFSPYSVRLLALSVFLGLMFFLSACEDEIDWYSKAVFVEFDVLECHLTNDTDHQQVFLSKSVSRNSDSLVPVSGAYVMIDDESRQFVFAENDTLPGVYSYQGLYPSVNRRYTLNVQIGDQQYQASTEMLPVTPLSPLYYHTCDESDTVFSINPSFTHVDSTGQEAMWEILFDYSGTNDSLVPEKRMLLYTLYSVDIPQILHPEKETICFPPGTKLIRNKYSITPDYARFIRSLLNETEWRGGNFDIIPANVITNIQGEQVRGFFSASAVVSDTLCVKCENE